MIRLERVSKVLVTVTAVERAHAERALLVLQRALTSTSLRDA
jgi:hypothetical protein